MPDTDTEDALTQEPPRSMTLLDKSFDPEEYEDNLSDAAVDAGQRLSSSFPPEPSDTEEDSFSKYYNEINCIVAADGSLRLDR